MARKRFDNRRMRGQGVQSRRMTSANRNCFDPPKPLELIERRQDLILHDHAAADCGDFHWTSASAYASAKTSSPSRNAPSEIESGGQILIVAPPNPTGENISSPFSIERRTMS